MSSPSYNNAVADDGMQKIFAALSTDNQKIEFIGKSQPGSSTSSGLWQIQKWTYDGNGFLTNIRHASGSTDFSFVWDNRANYAYS